MTTLFDKYFGIYSFTQSFLGQIIFLVMLTTEEEKGGGGEESGAVISAYVIPLFVRVERFCNLYSKEMKNKTN